MAIKTIHSNHIIQVHDWDHKTMTNIQKSLNSLPQGKEDAIGLKCSIKLDG